MSLSVGIIGAPNAGKSSLTNTMNIIMAFTLLPALQPRDKHAVVHGGSDNGALQHIDMVLTDEQGNAIYAEIPAALAAEKGPLIQQDKIYIIVRFKVTSSKSLYRPVDAQFMIEFTCYTTIRLADNPPSTFPRYVYKLTPFDEIEMHLGSNKKILDVLGIITEIFQPKTVHIPGQTAPTFTRDITIKDSHDTSLKITLWGERATQFTIDDVYNKIEPKPVIVLFVGCLPKHYKGNIYLSGSTSCHWYLNPTIPEAEIYYNRLLNCRMEIQCPTAPSQEQTEPSQPISLDHKFLKDLQNLDPYDFPDSGCLCTVTIASLPPNDTWWFPSCTKCGKSCNQDSGGYRCFACDCTIYRFKYKLTFIATDGTVDAEMFCFDNIAKRIVGKPCETLIKSMQRSNSTPPDLAAIISLKFTFAISIPNRSYHSRKKVFLINSILTSHGRQQVIPQLSNNIHQQGLSTPPKLALSTLQEDSPTTAMQKLCTTTPSPTNPPLAHITPQLPKCPSESSTKTDPLLQTINITEGSSACRKLFEPEHPNDQVNKEHNNTKKKAFEKSKHPQDHADFEPFLESPPKRLNPGQSMTQPAGTTDHKKSSTQDDK